MDALKSYDRNVRKQEGQKYMGGASQENLTFEGSMEELSVNLPRSASIDELTSSGVKKSRALAPLAPKDEEDEPRTFVKSYSSRPTKSSKKQVG